MGSCGRICQNALVLPFRLIRSTNLLSKPSITYIERLRILQTYRSFSGSKNVLCSNRAYEHTPESKSQSLGKIQPKLFLAFTCKKCNSRIEKHVSKIAYSKGVVIVRCDGCEENHLIADNLGWFPDLKSMRNIEDIMAAKGEKVKKSMDDFEIHKD